MFVDEVDIHVAAGDGGRGCLSFRREKFIPRGGPDGGDGGRGGSIWIVASPHLNTLVNFRFHPKYLAPRGGHGKGANRTGSNGRDLELSVPIGTLMYEKVEGELRLIADLAHEDQRARVAEGGLGGRGNAAFVSSTNRAPRRTQPGLPGEVEDLFNSNSSCWPTSGWWDFPMPASPRSSHAFPPRGRRSPTTRSPPSHPNLGVVRLDGERSFVVADVPGLIEGAHRGPGLGHRFLRHLERTDVLVHLIDMSSASSRDPIDDFETVARELELFSPELSAKIQLVAANKIDALDEPERLERLTRHLEARGIPIHPISAVTGAGVPALVEAMWRGLSEARAHAADLREHEAHLGSDRPVDTVER